MQSVLSNPQNYPMPYRIIAFSLFLILSFNWQCSPLWAAQDNDEDAPILEGIYAISRATLNEKNCEKEGDTTEYASSYLSVSGLPSSGYNVAVCNGESLEELDCVGGYQSTDLNEPHANGWQGFRYNARPGIASDNTPLCRLYSARRKIVLMGSGFIRYERTDWTETLSDFIAECNRDMAKLYSDAQSLKCSTHIVLFATRVAPPANK